MKRKTAPVGDPPASKAEARASGRYFGKNKNEEEIISIFNEIMEEIKKIELEEKIEFLEDKVSLNLNENLYSELLSLRNQLKKG